MSAVPASVATFWDRRHAEVGGLRSGGHLSFTETVNRRFYAHRLSQLLDVIGDRGSQRVPLRILDAGCGRGWFLAQLGALGHDVDGFDVSPNALATVRDLAPDARIRQSAILGYDAPRTYDVVYCIDVLIHIVDDDEWERSLRRLACLTSATGMLVITDAAMPNHDEPFSPADYIRFRPQWWYERIVSEHGLRRTRTVPYGFRGTRGGFHVYEAADDRGAA